MENVGAELLKEKQQVLISVLCLTNVYIFWVGQKVRLGFSIRSYGRKRKNPLAKPIYNKNHRKGEYQNVN